MTFVWYNYRRAPAVALAHRLVRSRSARPDLPRSACSLQSWGGPSTPLVWRFQAEVTSWARTAISMLTVLDAVRFVTGEEIVE